MVRAVYRSPLQEMVDLLERAERDGYMIAEFRVTQTEWNDITSASREFLPSYDNPESVRYRPPGYEVTTALENSPYLGYLVPAYDSKIHFNPIPIRLMDGAPKNA